MPATILIVDDEPDLTQLLAEHLSREGYRPLIARDGETALRLLEQTPCDLVLLDIMLPGIDGIDLLRRLRQGRAGRSDVPVIMLSAKDSPLDKTVGLSLGADDYLGKPFSLLELTARIQAVLRRAGKHGSWPSDSRRDATACPAPPASPTEPGPAGPSDTRSGGQATPSHHSSGRTPEAEILRCGPITIDLASAQVWVRDRPVTLTAREFRLLSWWVRNPGRVFTKQQIYEAVWEEPYVTDDNTVTVHIHRLRAKIEADPDRPLLIQTVRGLGYRLVCEP